MRLVGVEKDRANTAIRKTFGEGVHGWRRHPAIRSGETSELDEGVGMVRPDCGKTRLSAIQMPQREVRSWPAQWWAGRKVEPLPELRRDEFVVVVAGEQIRVGHHGLKGDRTSNQDRSRATPNRKNSSWELVAGTRP